MTWDRKDGEARRGPVRLKAWFSGLSGDWKWSRSTGTHSRAEQQGVLIGHCATEADARRAAEEAGDAFLRECVEAAPDEVLVEVLRARGWQMEDLAPTASEREMLAIEGLHTAAKVYRDRTGANLATALRVLSK